MTYRPYPNAERALRQLDRHTRTVPAREPTEFELKMARQATAAATAMLPLVVEAKRQTDQVVPAVAATMLRSLRKASDPATLNLHAG